MALMLTNTETAIVRIDHTYTYDTDEDDFQIMEMRDAARAALIAHSMYVPNEGPFSGFTMQMPNEMGDLAGVVVTLRAMFSNYDGGLAGYTYVRFPCSGHYMVHVAHDEDTGQPTATVQPDHNYKRVLSSDTNWRVI